MLGQVLRLLLPLLALLHCAGARVALTPKFFGQDSAVIVDTDKTRLNPKLQNALYYNFPVYKLINPASRVSSVPTTTTSTTTASPDEYPSDLLALARNKLGLKRTDQLPSLSELGELLGTGNAAETIKYIRTLTSNEQGIALMKAYLDSMTDYDQTESDAEEEQQPYNEDDNSADLEADYEALPAKQPKPETTALEPEQGLMQRVNEFMKQYSLWPAAESSTAKPVAYQPVFVAPVQAVAGKQRTPVLVRQPLPYHYPIPLRPVLMPQLVKVPPTTSTTTPAPTTSTAAPPTTAAPGSTAAPQRAPHLNSPRKELANVAPHVQQLAQIANISPMVLDEFLQQQPKLAELARRVSRLPLVQQHSRAIDSQLLLAVKKALAHDENLKRLLDAAETLK
ncbi:hypothetical protein KR222_009694 [Zaprionus bogoriensis]|nr:hypothetical protein KR222_009694 [Zaprionus bogoriensis]